MPDCAGTWSRGGDGRVEGKNRRAFRNNGQFLLIAAENASFVAESIGPTSSKGKS